MNTVIWKETQGNLKPTYKEFNVAWSPQPGSQEAFLSCPITEILYEGTRGPGKTDALLMKFAMHVGKGYGQEYRGIIFRKTYKNLEDLVIKSKKWFSIIFPTAEFNEAKYFWKFKTGELLYLRNFEKDSDYWNYHGHAYPFIAWEELTTWPNPVGYKKMFSCSRSTISGLPKVIVSTTNPYGVGHNWVKDRWRLPVPPNKVIGKVIEDSVDLHGKIEPPRVAIHGQLSENKILLHADPKYVDRIRASASNKAQLEAWLYGSWDIISGGMFDDIWNSLKDKIVISPFKIPSSWEIKRSFDWGQSKPFSVGWWGESDGTEYEIGNKKFQTVKGDLFRINEWYGCVPNSVNEGLKMLASDIAEGILQREKRIGLEGRVKRGVADSSIFDDNNGNNIAKDFQKKGIYWDKSDKSPGSRKVGWQEIRKRLSNTVSNRGLPREEPGLFIFDICRHWLRTVPVLPRCDKNLDDVDTNAEDHAADETRYMLSYYPKKAVSRSSVGYF